MLTKNHEKQYEKVGENKNKNFKTLVNNKLN